VNAMLFETLAWFVIGFAELSNLVLTLFNFLKNKEL
jgi:hypothetical protein